MWSERREGQIECLGVRPGAAQDFERLALLLHDLAERILEDGLDFGGRHGLVAVVDDGSIEIGHDSADEILRLADLGIRERDLAGVRAGARGAGARFRCKKQYRQADDHCEKDRAEGDGYPRDLRLWRF